MTRIEELALHLYGQLEEGSWKKSNLELIEDAIRNAYEEGQRSTVLLATASSGTPPTPPVA